MTYQFKIFFTNLLLGAQSWNRIQIQLSDWLARIKFMEDVLRSRDILDMYFAMILVASLALSSLLLIL